MKHQLILLHGALGSQKQFAKILPLLESDFEVRCFDFQGHGAQEAEADFSIDAFAENTLEFLKKHSLSQPTVFGYSMGGYVALKAEARQPGSFKQIITLGTKFDWNPESAAREARMLNPEKVVEKVPQFAAKLAGEHGAEDWKTVMRKTAQMMLDMGNGTGIKEAELHKVNTAVSIGRGSFDKMVSLEESQKAAEQIREAKLVELPEVPHVIEQIAPETVAAYIRASIGSA